MNYTLNQLKIFLQVAESQSITKAAEELFLTQPAVSIQLKNFQKQFSIPLTEVVGRQLYVTDFGNKIAEAAEKILKEVDAITYESMTYERLLAGKLKISVASTGKYVMPYFLSGFINEHRGIDLIMDVTNKTLVVNSLENNEVDFALVSTIPKDLDAYQLPLLQNKLYFIGSTIYKSKRKKGIREILKKYPLLFREPGSATRNSMEDFIKKKDILISKKVELTSNEAIKQAVIAGLGYSIMPLIGISDALKNGEIEIIPIRGLPIVSMWNLIWLKSKKLSPVANGLLEYLKAEKDRIRNEKFSWYEDYS